MSNFGIGWAIEKLELGRKVARHGWTGRGMYLFLSDGAATGQVTHAPGAKFSITCSSPEPLPIDPVICMRTAVGTIQPGWLASQADLLAHDWFEVE